MDKIIEMAAVMRQAAQIDEDNNFNKDRESMIRTLIIENKVSFRFYFAHALSSR